MHLTAVVAASENNVIGIANEMPWHLPDDLRFFKKTTLHHPIIMGKNTFLSLGKPLPNRINIVISSSLNDIEGVLLFKHIDEAIEYLEDQGIVEACIIGGGQIYAATLKRCNTIFLTRIHTYIENGEVFFPVINPESWTKTWEEYHPKDERHVYDFTFEKWEKN